MNDDKDGQANPVTHSVKEWLLKHEPDSDERSCIAEAIHELLILGTSTHGDYCVERGKVGATVSGPRLDLVLANATDLDDVLAAIAWADNAEERITNYLAGDGELFPGETADALRSGDTLGQSMDRLSNSPTEEFD